jgi:serine/threonine protein phosphatase 1
LTRGPGGGALRTVSDGPVSVRSSATSPPRRTYAVGDVHGRLDLLRLALADIAADAHDVSFRVVFLGDYVDRGPDSRGVVELLMSLQSAGWSAVCLKGNHEDLMLRAVDSGSPHALARWLSFGGGATLRSYGLDPHEELAIPRAHLRWLSGLPLTTGDAHRVYVHAGLAPKTPVHRQSERACLWIRERFLAAREGDVDGHVVHGHTPVWQGKPNPAEPELLAHRTNLDTGAFATGVLTVGVFDADTPGGPSKLLTIKGAPAPAQRDNAHAIAPAPEAGAH